MGYTTDFSGSIEINPPLSKEECDFLTMFNNSRRMDCEQGPYYIGRGGFAGQDADPKVRDHNRPPEGQPGLWCQWVPNEQGTSIVWDDGEKFYDSAEWMKYIIEHFIGANPLAKGELPFLTGHQCNGTIEALGEDSDDRWDLIVKDNEVSTQAFAYSEDGDPVEV